MQQFNLKQKYITRHTTFHGMQKHSNITYLTTGDEVMYNVIQIKYGLPYCITCPTMSMDPGSLNPGTRHSRVPGRWDPGIRTNTGAGDTVLAKHT